VTGSPAGGTPSQPNTELLANTKKEGFPANMPAQVEGGLISDITTGREVEIHPPGNVNLRFKKCITFDAYSGTLHVVMENISRCALRIW
jgi:hypothetical protein